MQNKGAIKLFAILLALSCIYYLSFTWITRSVEKDADVTAAEYVSKPSVLAKAKTVSNDTVLQRMYIDSVHGAVRDSILEDMRTKPVYNLGITSFTYEQCKEKEINLGLDLRGGMNVTLEVAVPSIIRGMSNNNPDRAFNAAIDNAVKKQSQSNKDFVTLFGEEWKNENKNGARLADIFNTMELRTQIKRDASDEEVLSFIRGRIDEAIETSEKTLRARIDKFGVTQPTIQKLATSGRILVELPGVKDKERVRKLLQGTANLEFWETYDNTEIYPVLLRVDEVLGRSSSVTGKDSTQKITANSDSVKIDSASVNKESKDSANLNLMAQLGQKDSAKGKVAMTHNDSLEKYRGEHPFMSIFAPSIGTDEKGKQMLMPGPIVGMALITDTAKINRMLNDKNVKNVLPPDVKFLWHFKPSERNAKAMELYAIKTPKDGKAPLAGDIISDANKQYMQTGGGFPEISMTMNAEAALLWGKLTEANVGKSIAIVLDNNVYSAPNVQSAIKGGQSQITGKFSNEEADDLVTVLKAGKLPAPAHIVEETVVGPTLGSEAISSGLLSFVIALVVVLVFMGIYYSKAGWVADLALLCNVFFVMGVLASLTAVLTLPGIAGIVLTIGMSVDANILIFERVREEMNAGKGTALAIKDGFRHAMSSIIDSNITTLLLGIILYVFGTGPIQGFATTLIIGILTSLFCAIFITRIIFDGMLKRNRVITFSTAATARMFKNANINFVQRRKIYYLFSGIVIVAGIVAFISKGGFNLGVDFKGGRTYVVRFDQHEPTDVVRKNLSVAFGNEPEVKTYGESNQQKITTTYLIDETSPDAQAKADAKLKEGLDKIGTHYEVVSSNMVNPSMSKDIQNKAVWAVLFSCLVMFVFIFIRFKKWQYGLGAVAALVHDVLVVLSFFVLFDGILPFSLEIGQDFIAAILTVMGYSMTDTVVVFDRIREYLTEKNKKDLRGDEQRNVINEALNNTLSRTVITSLTIFLVLLAIFLFGGTTIKGFTFALLIGIVIGTYSSICIATPVVIDFSRKKKEEESVPARA